MNFYSIKLKLHNLKKCIFQVKGQNKIFSSKAKRFKVKYDIVGSDNDLNLGDSMLHHVLIYVRGKNNKLVIGSGCYLKNTNLMFEGNNCEIVIGKGTTIEGAHIDVKENNMKISIGENNMFSDEIYLSTSDSHSILNDIGERINPPKPIFIGKNVWLGKRSMILKGSIIEDDTIIAAGSIVTGKISGNSIYAGNPAKKVKENTHWLRERL